MPILELLADVEEVDPNLADNDGNTPLIFAAQAGNIHCTVPIV
jgi:ankyrin repeat protein